MMKKIAHSTKETTLKETPEVSPRGRVGRMNSISGRMKRFLTGPVWRDPLFTDDTLMEVYRTKKKMKVVKGLKDDVAPIKVSTK